MTERIPVTVPGVQSSGAQPSGVPGARPRTSATGMGAQQLGMGSGGLGPGTLNEQRGISGQTAWDMLCSTQQDIQALTGVTRETHAKISAMLDRMTEVAEILRKMLDEQRVANDSLELAANTMMDSAALLAEYGEDLGRGMKSVKTATESATEVIASDAERRR